MNNIHITKENSCLSRELDIVDESSRIIDKVVVLIGQPALEDDGDTWSCRYSIYNLEDEPINGGASGIDALQALNGVLLGINALLEGMNMTKNRKLQWCGRNNDLMK